MNSLKSEIFVFFMILLLSAMTLIFSLVYRATYQHTLDQIEMQLLSGYQVFKNDLQARQQFQSGAAEVVTQDFGLRSEIASFSKSSNAESLRVTLDNFRMRSDAQLAVATSAEHRILASTSQKFLAEKEFPYLDLLDPSSSPHAVLKVVGDDIFQLFSTPIYAPKPNLIGWFILGFSLDDQTATRLAKLTNLNVSFVYLQNDHYRVIASSLIGEGREALGAVNNLPVRGHATISLLGHDHVVYVQPLSDFGNAGLSVVLQQSLTEALRDYVTLQWQLLFILILALLLSAGGAFFIASTVSRPLMAMVNYVHRIASGDYKAVAPATKLGEVSMLVNEFSSMQKAIAEREATIAHKAFHDALTDLPNRLRFQQILQAAIDRNKNEKCIAVLVFGLNHFKDINDTLGHFSGDQLLKQLTQRFQAILRKQDTLARLGGDGFAILLTDIDRADLISSTLHYRKVLVEPFHIEGIALTVNASVGIAIYPEHGENPAMLLQRTEIAMYISKEKKLTYALYSGHENRYSLLRLSLMSELKDAIGRGELQLYYQPKLAIATQTIFGVECLVRWKHPVHGFISPDDFIPLAEQTGNIRYLTAWVVDTALKQHRIWRERGLNLIMAVNISAVDLQDETLLEHIDRGLLREKVSPSSLILEVTESGVMNDVDNAIALLSRMQKRGLGLSIDDYGTGYSSMAQLKRLPVDELKIDKSFVLDVVTNTDDAIIVRSTIELGHNMGLKLVAEGVESLEALDKLRQYGCDYAQGYYLSKPMPAEDFANWLKQSPYNHEV